MEPTVRVEQVAVQPGEVPGRWRVTWRIENHGDRPLTVLAARCPHGKFRSGEREFSVPVVLEANRSTAIELKVDCKESSGTVVENAFLILRVVWAGKPWLILARLRVLVNDAGAPETVTELITTQPVGFSLRETAD
jgi:hypothetical protein